MTICVFISAVCSTWKWNDSWHNSMIRIAKFRLRTCFQVIKMHPLMLSVNKSQVITMIDRVVTVAFFGWETGEKEREREREGERESVSWAARQIILFFYFYWCVFIQDTWVSVFVSAYIKRLKSINRWLCDKYFLCLKVRNGFFFFSLYIKKSGMYKLFVSNSQQRMVVQSYFGKANTT